MQIKVVKLFENGFMTRPFALGGEDGVDKFENIKYRSSLQNYLIDTGKEVILVDTGMPAGSPSIATDTIYIGSKIKDYVDALADLGYKPEQVSKILITHKHPDHTGELRSFPNAKIYASKEEKEDMEFKGDNVIAVEYKDGPYHNFEASEKIAEGIYFLPAKGHTRGNSIVIVESEGLFYMIHGDVTYTDEALYENKISIAFEDLKLARETLDKVREFIKNNPTVYLSTHTPLGYENLENKKIVDLNNPPKSIPPNNIESVKKESTGKYVCSICGYVYDPAKGDPEHGIPVGTKFEDLPTDWHCPRCKQPKDKFGEA